MSGYRLLLEYLRACQRLKTNPSKAGRKRVAQLRFLDAHLCPVCGEEVEPDDYRLTVAEHGRVEGYACSGCGCAYTFPRRALQ